MQYVDCEEFAGEASFAADVAFWLLSPGGGCAYEGFPVTEMHDAWCKKEVWSYLKVMVVGEGFEPSKSMTADLQSAPFGRSGTPPRGNAFTGLLPYREAGRIISNDAPL